MHGPQTHSIGTILELIRNADFQALPQIYWGRIYILTRLPGTLLAHLALRSTVENDLEGQAPMENAQVSWSTEHCAVTRTVSACEPCPGPLLFPLPASPCLSKRLVHTGVDTPVCTFKSFWNSCFLSSALAQGYAMDRRGWMQASSKLRTIKVGDSQDLVRLQSRTWAPGGHIPLML